MRLPWTVRGTGLGTATPRAGAAESGPDVLSACASGLGASGEVERLLAAFRIEPTLQAPEGFEARLFARLEAQSNARRASAERRSAFVQGGLRGWTPIVLAASLVCVFVGGLMVERETATSIEEQSRHQQASAPPHVSGSGLAGETRSLAVIVQPQAVAPGDSLPGSSGLITASARLRPTVPVPVGRRRGRANGGLRTGANAGSKTGSR